MTSHIVDKTKEDVEGDDNDNENEYEEEPEDGYPVIEE
jgi:hypothetical protein